MVTLSGGSLDSQTHHHQQKEAMEKVEAHSPGISDYELSREERIKENRERMQKLGIFDLSLKFRSVKPTSNKAFSKKIARGRDLTPPPKPGPVRRSSRLQKSTPVNYNERVAKQDKSFNDDDLLREVGSKPEIYTDEHEKLLGSTERSWEFFVDGYGRDGKRIYDPVRGKTCHQCRQKTLGHRTHCSNCDMVQGQFCGDCLYMRYGEHVLEANENPDWICPVCRGICNCSLCRQAKGWAPTGLLYRKISSLGYKSVAHYLIKTRRADVGSDENAGDKVPISSKRSLHFTDVETTAGDDISKASAVSLDIGHPPPEVEKESAVSSECDAGPPLDSVLISQPKHQVELPLDPELKQCNSEYGIKKESDSLVPDESNENRMEPTKATDHPPASSDYPVGLLTSNNEIKKEESMSMDNGDVATNTYPEKPTEPLNDASPPDSSNDHGDLLISNYRVKKVESMNTGNKDVPTNTTPTPTKKKRMLPQTTPDSVAGRLRLRRLNPNAVESLELVNAKKARQQAKDTSKTADGDSIASRLKRRSKT